MNFNQEPTDIELDEIQKEYADALQRFPIETDREKSLGDWSGLIAQYVMLALGADDDIEAHHRYIQAAQLSIRAAQAVRRGDYKPDRFRNGHV